MQTTYCHQRMPPVSSGIPGLPAFVFLVWKLIFYWSIWDVFSGLLYRSRLSSCQEFQITWSNSALEPHYNTHFGVPSMLELNHLVMRMCTADLGSETEMWKVNWFWSNGNHLSGITKECISSSNQSMIIANTWFKKNDTGKKVTIGRDNCKIAINFIRVQKSERSIFTDVNVINTKAFIPHHELLICKVRQLRLLEKTVISRRVLFVSRVLWVLFVSRIKVWCVIMYIVLQNDFHEFKLNFF